MPRFAHWKSIRRNQEAKYQSVDPLKKNRFDILEQIFRPPSQATGGGNLLPATKGWIHHRGFDIAKTNVPKIGTGT